MVDHAGNKNDAENFTVKSEEAVVLDLATQTRPDIGSTDVGVAFANHAEVYNATMVAKSCDYCHLPDVRTEPMPERAGE